MYKLLLVSDQEDVLDAFSQVDNWGYNGFHQPHIRHDLDGAKEGLQRHHVDGIAFALDDAQEKKLFEYLREKYPLLSIMEPGRSVEEVRAHLYSLRQVLNHLRADFSSDIYDEQEMFIRARRHLFRSLLGGRNMTCRQLSQEMLMLRSRMDPDKPCVLMSLERSASEEDWLMGHWNERDHLLERALFQSFGGDLRGMHVLPLVTEDGSIWVLAGSIRGEEVPENATQTLDACVRDGIQHAEEYRGLRLKVGEMRIYPNLYALCTDYQA